VAYRLSTLPAGPTLIVTLLGLLAGLAFVSWLSLEESALYTRLAVSPLSDWVRSGLMMLTLAMFFVVLYHTLHQLREISHVLATHTRINLFEVSPIYGLSGVTGLTAVLLIIPALSRLLTVSSSALSLAGMFSYALFLVIPAIVVIATFVAPLLGVHRLLARKKDELLGANARMIEATSAELHRKVLDESQDMTRVIGALASLEVERRLILSAATWPWSPQTPRAVAAGLLLPLLIWVIQRVLERLLV
jgi:hypothetical protein